MYNSLQYATIQVSMKTPYALAKEIEREYFQNFNRLSQMSQYHLLNHLYLWNGHTESASQLPAFKSSFYGNSNLVRDRMTHLYDSAPKLPIKNAAELRLPYLKMYPSVRSSALVMLDALYANSLFGLDVRPILKEIMPANIDSVFHKLKNDYTATFYLSTYGVNFLYLYDKYFCRANTLKTEQILRVIATHELTSDQEFVLHCYYLTHTIINESSFYSQPLSETSVTQFREHLEIIDKCLLNSSMRDMLNLDCKLELLVCAKMCAVELTSKQAILSEAMSSVSADGTFLIDRHNKVGQYSHSDLDKSEHRNALFLMSQLEYDPSPKPILN